MCVLKRFDLQQKMFSSDVLYPLNLLTAKFVQQDVFIQHHRVRRYKGADFDISNGLFLANLYQNLNSSYVVDGKYLCQLSSKPASNVLEILLTNKQSEVKKNRSLAQTLPRYISIFKLIRTTKTHRLLGLDGQVWLKWCPLLVEDLHNARVCYRSVR